ncbi:MAG TPA: cation:proton antiporter [Stellaceae bacterium]|jgi:CPA2 family monovalent cation:H+ antiporter-2|nr:cation:proton antiporter [Stellaceae bacterium]
MSIYVPTLLATIVICLAAAYLFGMAARALRLPPLVGYLLAGVAIGPFTPGYVADAHLVAELADIGVALLLFGVGLHFSLSDLLSVWRVAVPGAALQVAGSTLVGFGVGYWLLGWPTAEAVLLGFGLAIASTAVATRTLEEQGRLGSEAGRVALGWLVVQDLAVILVLVLLPAVTTATASPGNLVPALGRTVLELAGFVVVVVLAGRRVIPWMLALTARAGSRELFTLAVILVALGVAYGSAQLFGVSLALGAFFAGVVLAESDLSHQAAAESLPVQQLFTVLFFVSVGLLIDPTVVLRLPLQVGAVLLAVLVGIGFVTLIVLLALRVQPAIAVTVASALAQIGEFSFILAGTAVDRGIMPVEGRSIILAGALAAILVNPLIHFGNERLGAWLEQNRLLGHWLKRGRRLARGAAPPRLADHALVIGQGRVGGVVVAALQRYGIPLVIIEQDRHIAERSRDQGLPVIYGDATRPDVIKAGHPERAKLLIVAIPDRFLARRVIELARHANPRIDVVVRTHSDEEAAWLGDKDVGLVVMSERETALGIAEYALHRFGADAEAARQTLEELRAAKPAAG